MSVLYARDKNDKLSPVPNIKVVVGFGGSDDSYNKGYADGKKDGFNEGYGKGYEEGDLGGRYAGKQEGIAIGREEGKAIGRAEGITEGKQAEYDAFWNGATDNWTKTDFTSGFRGASWNDATYKPPRVIAPTIANAMFHSSAISEKKIEVDFSQCTDLYQAFYLAKAKYIGVVDCRSVTSASGLHQCFANANRIVSIDEIIVDENTKFAYSFSYTNALAELRMSGTLAQNGLDFKNCIHLSKESHKSVIEVLSTTTSGLTVTFSKSAVDKAFRTEPSKEDGSTSAEWDELKARRKNWNIALS